MGEVVGKSPSHADDVDSVVAVEALILGRNNSVLEDQRHLGERYRPPTGAAQPCLDAAGKRNRVRTRQPRSPTDSSKHHHRRHYGNDQPAPSSRHEALDPHLVG